MSKLTTLPCVSPETIMIRYVSLCVVNYWYTNSNWGFEFRHPPPTPFLVGLFQVTASAAKVVVQAMDLVQQAIAVVLWPFAGIYQTYTWCISFAGETFSVWPCGTHNQVSWVVDANVALVIRAHHPNVPRKKMRTTGESNCYTQDWSPLMFRVRCAWWSVRRVAPKIVGTTAQICNKL